MTMTKPVAKSATKDTAWELSGEYTDIQYHKWEGIAKITINRPEVRNAFRPLTVEEMRHALADARDDHAIGVIILTGAGRDAFCSGGDQRIRGEAGYRDESGIPRLNVLDFQREIRTCPKPVVAMVAGYAIGGGHVLHVICDLTIAADHSIFGQVGPRVGSFDGGYGASYLARIVGQKKLVKFGFYAVSTMLKKRRRWGLSTASFLMKSLKPRRSVGARRCSAYHRWPCAV